MVNILLKWIELFAIILITNKHFLELVGTPGYLAPELLKSNMFEGLDGYGKEVDM
jgi:phosphorylase kinase gamma subunit